MANNNNNNNNPLQLKSLNHVSLLCGSVDKSIDFYVNILGFCPIQRPTSFDFNGAWHCESIAAVERRLKQMKIKYVKNIVEENGIYVDQLFFHDPDGWMIEICNCDKLPVVPLCSSSSPFNCNIPNHHLHQQILTMDQQ
ncbi:hypothetical protein Ahy_A01g000454 [Arachis hypogaea]|uniref:Glyoxalase/fosfomycin resistance/dioxygenase domain-containing protein n=1 Tax=Arachis hypogaea TaxID=3818 RepID=A0A445EKD8_ARAHY|nr:hypothetical protein Ahy_A01g000454 [Arachis hypogaea]